MTRVSDELVTSAIEKTDRFIAEAADWALAAKNVATVHSLIGAQMTSRRVS